MTQTSHKKILKQVGHKEGKHEKYKKHNTPKDRPHGKGQKECRFCGRHGAHIKRYGLDICRQCFREKAEDLGFKKYS